MKNYISNSKSGLLCFFEDTDDIASSRARAMALQPGGAVYRRPPGKSWLPIPQIRGDYDCAVGEQARRARPHMKDDVGRAECSCPRCRKHMERLH